MEFSIIEIIDNALALAGYKIMDGGHDFIILRQALCDEDYEITVKALPV